MMTSSPPSSPASMAPTAARSLVGTSWIASSGRPAACSPSTRQAWIAAEECRESEPPLQDRRVACLEAQRAGIGGDVRPALVDHADHAERRAHALDPEAVRPLPGGRHLAHRVGQRGNGTDAFGHAGEPRPVERQPVHLRRGEPGLAAVVQVLGVGGQDRLGAALDRLGHRRECRVLALRAGDGQRPLGRPGAPSQVLHEPRRAVAFQRLQHG